VPIYLEYNSVCKDSLLSPQNSKMDSIRILCTLDNFKSFLGAFPSDLLPHSITRPITLIVNTDAHTRSGSHWLAIHLDPRSPTSFYFESYGLSPHIHHIQSSIRRNCTVLNYNNVQLQGPMSTVWANIAGCSPCTWVETTH